MLGSATKCAGATARAQVSGRCAVEAGGEHELAALELALREIDVQRPAVPLQLRALGPGDRVGPAVGRIGRVHHCKHRLAVAQQRHRDRRAAPAGGEFERAVVRVDEPGHALHRARAAARLLADERAVDQRAELLAQRLLDLDVDRAGAALATRPIGAIELGAQPRAFCFDG
jgi:hypothetical protein